MIVRFEALPHVEHVVVDVVVRAAVVVVNAVETVVVGDEEVQADVGESGRGGGMPCDQAYERHAIPCVDGACGGGWGDGVVVMAPVWG